MKKEEISHRKFPLFRFSDFVLVIPNKLKTAPFFTE